MDVLNARARGDAVVDADIEPVRGEREVERAHRPPRAHHEGSRAVVPGGQEVVDVLGRRHHEVAGVVRETVEERDRGRVASHHEVVADAAGRRAEEAHIV